MNTIPFKNRTIDLTAPVFVYRNLNKKGVWYSIKQNGLVVAHSKKMSLKDCEFVVNHSGKLRAQKTKTRNVHAFIKGTYLPNVIDDDLPFRITYYPFSKKGFNIEKAKYVTCNELGCYSTLQ
jgi:hypothetical protein